MTIEVFEPFITYGFKLPFVIMINALAIGFTISLLKDVFWE